MVVTSIGCWDSVKYDEEKNTAFSCVISAAATHRYFTRKIQRVSCPSTGSRDQCESYSSNEAGAKAGMGILVGLASFLCVHDSLMVGLHKNNHTLKWQVQIPPVQYDSPVLFGRRQRPWTILNQQSILLTLVVLYGPRVIKTAFKIWHSLKYVYVECKVDPWIVGTFEK
jgi:hypothetical protein